MTLFELAFLGSDYELFRGLLYHFTSSWEHNEQVKTAPGGKVIVFCVAGTFQSPESSGLTVRSVSRKEKSVLIFVGVGKERCESADRNEILEYLLETGAEIVSIATVQLKKSKSPYDSGADLRFLENYRRQMLS